VRYPVVCFWERETDFLLPASSKDANILGYINSAVSANGDPMSIPVRELDQLVGEPPVSPYKRQRIAENKPPNLKRTKPNPSTPIIKPPPAEKPKDQPKKKKEEEKDEEKEKENLENEQIVGKLMSHLQEENRKRSLVEQEVEHLHGKNKELQDTLEKQHQRELQLQQSIEVLESMLHHAHKIESRLSLAAQKGRTPTFAPPLQQMAQLHKRMTQTSHEVLETCEASTQTPKRKAQARREEEDALLDLLERSYMQFNAFLDVLESRMGPLTPASTATFNTTTPATPQPTQEEVL
jgi:hypothetical protein